MIYYWTLVVEVNSKNYMSLNTFSAAIFVDKSLSEYSLMSNSDLTSRMMGTVSDNHFFIPAVEDQFLSGFIDKNDLEIEKKSFSDIINGRYYGLYTLDYSKYMNINEHIIDRYKLLCY